MTAGCVAALRAWIPELSIEQVETALKASCTSVTDPKNSLLFPFLDCEEAKTRLEREIFSPFVDGFEASDC